MNVAELKKLLEQYPDSLEIVFRQYSDLTIMVPDDIGLTMGVPKSGGWVMQSHPTMSAENKAREQQFLCFPGK